VAGRCKALSAAADLAAPSHLPDTQLELATDHRVDSALASNSQAPPCPCSVRRECRADGAAATCAVAREDVVVSNGSAKTALEVLGALLRTRRLAADLSLRELSARTSVSNAYLSELERGLHEPSLRVLRAIASALDTPLGAMLESAGVLGDSGEGGRESELGDTEAAIARDPALSEPQRVALLSVYRSFVQSSTLR
jgi:transcriptional regulator with XRE-family HTH domain